MNVGELNVKLKADLKAFSANMTKAADQMRSFARTVGNSMAKATKSIARFAANAARSMAQFVSRWMKRATIGIGAFLVAATKMAIDVEEAENLVRESFGNMTEAVIDWSENLQKSLGLNASSLREQSAYLNLLNKSLGLTEKQAYKVSTSLVELSQHIASLRNKKFDVVFEKMRSGLVGMTRPLQDIGINIKENAIEEFLLKEGIDATVDSMTEAQKIMARYILILRATTSDQGDLVRTYDSTQNIIRVIISQIKILMEQMGAKLLPIVNAVAKSFRDWLIENREGIVLWFGDMVGHFQRFINFLRTDFHQGFSGSMQVLVKISEAIGRAIVEIFRSVFTEIGTKLPIWIIQGWWTIRNRIMTAKKNIQINMAEWFMSQLTGAEPVYHGLLEGTLSLKDKIPIIWRDLARDINAIMDDTFTKANQTGWWGAVNAFDKIEKYAKEKFHSIGLHFKAMWSQQKMKKSLDDALAALKSELNDIGKTNENVNNKIVDDTDETLTEWQQMWKDASSSIAGSMESAFSDIVENVGNVTQAISNMLRQIGRAISGAVFQQYIGPHVFDLLKPIVPLQWPTSRATSVQENPYQPLQYGGQVPLYAQYGRLHRGTDTVPAMLSPGEAVIPERIVDQLRRGLQVEGSGQTNQVNITVQAIDAQNTMQFLSKNKRMIAGMMEREINSNHSLRRQR